MKTIRKLLLKLLNDYRRRITDVNPNDDFFFLPCHGMKEVKK